MSHAQCIQVAIHNKEWEKYCCAAYARHKLDTT